MDTTPGVTQNRNHALLRREALEIVGGLGWLRGLMATALGVVTLGATLASVLAPHPDFSPGTALAFGGTVFALGVLLISKL